jgi:LruC domain-containing protein
LGIKKHLTPLDFGVKIVFEKHTEGVERSMIKHTAVILTLVVLAAILGSCGGGPIGSGINTNPTPGLIFAPDTSGSTGNNPLDENVYGPSTPITGSNEAAPLGTDPNYGMELIESETTFDDGRAISSLADGDPFEIFDVTLTTAAVTDAADVNWTASPLVFDEGTPVKLWMRFGTQGGITVTRTWDISAPVNFTNSETVSLPDQGTFISNLLTALPEVDGGDKTATFTATLDYSPRSGSVVIIVPDDPFNTSKNVTFTIHDIPKQETPPSCWQLQWEQKRTKADWDYNDMVARVCTHEVKNAAGDIIGFDFQVKPLARGDGYSASWQYNMTMDFPAGTGATTTTQIIRTGGKEGKQRVWRSTGGIDVPAMHPGMNILPSPPGGGSTVNVIAGEEFMNGGFVDIHVMLDSPIPPGSYSPMPIRHHFIVSNSTASAYEVEVRYGTGANKIDATTSRPTGFIIPAQIAWSLQGRDQMFAYPRFDTWCQWIRNGQVGAEPKWWLDTPVYTTGGTKNAYRADFFQGGLALPIPEDFVGGLLDTLFNLL